MSGANAIGAPGEQAPDGAQVLAGVDENGALAVPTVTTGSPPAGAARIAVHVTNLGGGAVPGGATEATLQDILADTAQLPADPASDTAVAAVEAAVAAVEGHLPAQVASEATLGTLGTEATLDLVRVAAQALVTALGSPAGGAAGATALAAVKTATEGLQTALGSPAGGVAGATALASAVSALQAIQAAIGSPAGGAAGATALASLLAAAQAIQALQGGGLPATLDGGALRVHEQGLGETPNREVGRVTTTGSATIATEATAQAILADTASIPADPAREGGHLAAIDTSTARIPASPATETGHLATIDTSTATAVVTLASILAKITNDPATQTTLAAVLSALGSLATAAKQDTLAGLVATAARQDTGNTSVATIAARTPPLGQAASAASTPVVIASDQSTVNVDTSLPAFTANDPGIVSFPAAAKSTFGQLAVVEPYGLFSEDFRFGVDSTIWAATATGGAVLRHLPNLSAVRLEVSGASQVARVRSQYPIAYQRGRMHDAIVTGFSSSTAALTIVRRSSVTGSAVDAPTAQVAWAGVLDGSFTPPAWDKANIFEIGFNWLGVGPERMLINTLLAHTINTPGQLAAPWAATAVLPVTAELQTDAGGNWTLRIGYFDDLDGLFYEQTGSGAATFTFMCSSVSSVGGQDPRLQARGFARSGNDVNVTTEVPLFALRPATTWAATNATITGVTAAANRTQFWPRHARVKSETANVDINVYLNPTALTGGAWVSAGTDSAAEVNITATAFTGGTPIGSVAGLSGSYGELDLEDNFSPVARRFGVRYDGNRDVLLVTAAKQSGGGGATQCRATTVWGELR